MTIPDRELVEDEMSPEEFGWTIDQLNSQLARNAKLRKAASKQQALVATSPEAMDELFTPQENAPSAPQPWSETIRDALLFSFLACMGVGFALSYVVINWQHGN